MLTARDAVADRIEGLDAGADDYMVKPFDVDELQGTSARAAAPRRRRRRRDRWRARRSGSCDSIRSATGRSVGERFVELTRTEYQLLELLMLNPRRVLPHSLIYDRVWGYDFGPTSNALRVYIGYLRRKLEDGGRHLRDPHGARRRLRAAGGRGGAVSLRVRMGLAAGVAVALAVSPSRSRPTRGTRSELLQAQLDSRSMQLAAADDQRGSPVAPQASLRAAQRGSP